MQIQNRETGPYCALKKTINVSPMLNQVAADFPGNANWIINKTSGRWSPIFLYNSLYCVFKNFVKGNKYRFDSAIKVHYRIGDKKQLMNGKCKIYLHMLCYPGNTQVFFSSSDTHLLWISILVTLVVILARFVILGLINWFQRGFRYIKTIDFFGW